MTVPKQRSDPDPPRVPIGRVLPRNRERDDVDRPVRPKTQRVKPKAIPEKQIKESTSLDGPTAHELPPDRRTENRSRCAGPSSVTKSCYPIHPSVLPGGSIARSNVHNVFTYGSQRTTRASPHSLEATIYSPLLLCLNTERKFSSAMIASKLDGFLWPVFEARLPKLRRSVWTTGNGRHVLK